MLNFRDSVIKAQRKPITQQSKCSKFFNCDSIVIHGKLMVFLTFFSKRGTKIGREMLNKLKFHNFLEQNHSKNFVTATRKNQPIDLTFLEELKPIDEVGFKKKNTKPPEVFIHLTEVVLSIFRREKKPEKCCTEFEVSYVIKKESYRKVC